jgi:Na+/H+-translocating membrane pyrophosphatase
VLGAITSTVSGYFGMQIATFTNTKVAYMAQSSLEEGFKVAYRAGCVMGFFLTSLGLLVLTILIAIYRSLKLSGETPPTELIKIIEQFVLQS